MLLSAASLCLVVQEASSYQSMLNKMNTANQNKREGPYLLNQSVLLASLGEGMKVNPFLVYLSVRRCVPPLTIIRTSRLKLSLRFLRAPGDPIYLIHFRLNDSNPYGIIGYAGSVSERSAADTAYT